MKLKTTGLKRSFISCPPLWEISQRLARYEVADALRPLIHHAGEKIANGFAVWKAHRYLVRTIKKKYGAVEMIDADDEGYIFSRLIRHAYRVRNVLKSDYPPRTNRRLWR